MRSQHENNVATSNDGDDTDDDDDGDDDDDHLDNSDDHDGGRDRGPTQPVPPVVKTN